MGVKQHKNPLIQRKYEEGYALGLEHGIQKGVNFFTHKLEGLEQVDGIGEKTMEKVREQLGNQYFYEKERNK